MLYGNESISHYSRSNISIWMLMAFQAGTINVGAFMACSRFVSHVTGFATLFGYEVSQSRYKHSFVFLVVPFFFLLGAMLSGFLVDIRLKLHKKPKYYLSFGLIFLLNTIVLFGGVLGYFGKFGDSVGSIKNSILLIILCLVCGIQNGTMTTVSKSVIRTTHLTGITTDLGISVVRVLNRHKIDINVQDEMRAILMRIGIIVFFGFGCVVGGFVYYKNGFSGFTLPVISSGLLFFASLYFLKIKSAAQGVLQELVKKR